MSMVSKTKSFTLVEVMVAASLLAFGVLLVARSYITALNAFGYYDRYMSIDPWLTQMLWRAQDNLARQGSLGELESSGVVAADNKSFQWDMTSMMIDQIKDCCQLYRIDVTASWKVYAKQFSLTKSAYVLYQE